MNYLSAEGIGKSFHDKWLFKDITFGIGQGEKLALVGNNGVGKTTFLKILTGQLAPDAGSLSVRDGIRIGYLKQQVNVAPNALVEDILFSADNKIANVVKEYEHCLHHPDVSPEKMQAVLIQMEELNAWDYDSKVNEVIGKLGVPDLEKKFSELSGGQKKRIFLAQLLLQEPDLIILDEPTNHLDLTAIEWLENYLSGQMITLIMVTHDRYFLDNVATEILEIDRAQLYRYKGNYAYFLEKKSMREDILKAEVSKARNLLKKELEWMRRQPRARGTKAKYRIDAYHDLKEVASQDLKKEKLELDIKTSRQGGKILEVKSIAKAYGDNKLVKDFSYVFKKGDRIGVVGKNGIGKSTFLDMLSGKIKPDTGEAIPGVTTKYGYFTQESIDLNPEHRVIEEVKEIAEFITMADGTQLSASRFLESFLFPPEQQYSYISKLSGGERKRLQLMKLLITNPNFLILDEPTNDFDIDTLNVLEDFLIKFSGCLLLVSHDRYFMDHLVDQLFVFEGDGNIRIFNGNYSDYREWVAEQEANPKKTEEKKVAPIEKNSSEGKKKLSYNDKRELENLPAEIKKLEDEKTVLTEKLTTTSTADHQQLQEWSEKIQKLVESIEQKTMRWLELSEME